MKTRLSLDEVDGAPVLVWCMNPRERPACDIDQKGNLLELIANADNAVSLIRGFEAFEFPPIYPYVPLRKDGSSPDARVLADAVSNNPTPAKLRSACEAVRAWSPPSDLWDQSQGFIPVSECMDMARDLKAVCSIYAYSIGECSAAMLERNLSKGIRFMEFPSASEDSKRSLYEDYLNEIDSDFLLRSHILFRDAKGVMLSRQPDGSEMLLFQYTDETITHECGWFGRFAMNAFMRDAAPCIMHDGSFSAYGDSGFGKAYAYFAEALCAGKASVCDYCGNVFTRRRSTKRYCSDSCKVAMSKAGLTNGKADPAR